MSGDAMKKVRPGDRLKIPAKTFNTFIDAARDFQDRQRNMSRDARPDAPQPGIILVKNSSGEDRGLFEILALDGPLYGPEDNEDAFKFRFALKGVRPDLDHLGNFAVLLEPVKDGALGRALIQGITPVRVRVQSGEEVLNRADLCFNEGQEFQHLRLADWGTAQVLWKESGTGTKWALVRLAPPEQPVSFWGRIAGREAVGNRWRYYFKEVRKNSAGYGGWAEIQGGIWDWAYNGAEDPDPGEYPWPYITDGAIVRITVVPCAAGTEFWITGQFTWG